MSEQPSGASDGQDNVYPLHVESGDVIDPTITAKILNLDTISALRDYTDIAAQTIRTSVPGTTSNLGINSGIEAGAEEQLSQDQQLAIAELQVLMAKHGKTPPTSVEGIIQLQSMLVDVYRDNMLQPKEVELELEKLKREIRVLAVTYDDFLRKKILKAKEDATRAEEAVLAATRAVEKTQGQLEVDRIRGGIAAQEAEVEVAETSVAIKRRRGQAKNDDSVIEHELLADSLDKRIKTAKAVSNTVVGGVVRPVLGKLIKLVLIALLVAIVYSFIMEQAGMHDYPLLDTADSIRHWILDPIYKAITNNVAKIDK